MNAYVKIKETFVKVLETVVITVMAVLVIDVVWQVFTRFVLRNPSSWTEELATMLLIWVSLLGASVALIRKGHLGVDYFVNKLKSGPRSIVDIFIYAMVGFFSASVMIAGGIRLVWLTLLTNQLSPAMGIRMGYVYLALPLSGFFMLVFSIESILGGIKRIKEIKEVEGKQ